MLGWPPCPHSPHWAYPLPPPPKEPNLKVYSGQNIRNVALVGHGHAGKTTLVSAMLFTAGATQRLGRAGDGSGTTSHHEEEIARKIANTTRTAKGVTGVVDLVRMKAYAYELGGNGKGKETEIPANMRAQVQEAHEQLVELVAEGDDKLMEEFFEKGTIPEEDLIPALHNAIREDKLFPVIFSSGLGNVGADRVMDFIVDYTPAPSEHEWVQGEPVPSGNGDAPKRHETDDEPVSLYVFKTLSDAFSGRISYFKVFSCVLKNDATLQNFSR